MGDVNGPLIVRHNSARTKFEASYVKPGLHSHNAARRLGNLSFRLKAIRRIRILLLVVGFAFLGYYGYTLSDLYVYQTYQNWAFDQQIAGRKAVTFADYVRERTPFGFLAGARHSEAVATTKAVPAPPTEPAPAARPVSGSLLGKVEIARLNVSAVVREGVDDETLSTAVGHIPSTALPGQAGNFAIAAHRDTLFRALKDIKKDDVVTFQSPSGSYSYRVLATKIVKPSDVSVLRSDGGGLIPETQLVAYNGKPAKLLTMITCYPFYYVGSAPKRFIVQGELVLNDEEEKPTRASHPADTGPPEAEAGKTAKQASPSELRSSRSSSRVSGSRARRTRDRAGAKTAAKKRGFWHKLFHVS